MNDKNEEITYICFFVSLAFAIVLLICGLIEYKKIKEKERINKGFEDLIKVIVKSDERFGVSSKVYIQYFQNNQFSEIIREAKKASPDLVQRCVKETKKRIQSANDPVSLYYLIDMLIRQCDNNIISKEDAIIVCCNSLKRIMKIFGEDRSKVKEKKQLAECLELHLSYLFCISEKKEYTFSNDQTATIANALIYLSEFLQIDGYLVNFIAIHMNIEIMKYVNTTKIEEALIILKKARSLETKEKNRYSNKSYNVIYGMLNKVLCSRKNKGAIQNQK